MIAPLTARELTLTYNSADTKIMENEDALLLQANCL